MSTENTVDSPAVQAFNSLTAKEQHAAMGTYISNTIFGMISMTPKKAQAKGSELKAKFEGFLVAEPKLLQLISDAIDLSKEPK
jgi:hypothetical protein